MINEDQEKYAKPAQRHPRLDLREQINHGCKKCPRLDRNENTDDGVCTVTVSGMDGQPVRCVGQWAQKKIHFLTQYLGNWVSPLL